MIRFAMLGVLVVTLLGLPRDATAQTRPTFPETLFDVRLGSVHSLGGSASSKDVGTLSVAEIKGVQSVLGSGIHVYFKPIKTHQAFQYVEKRKKPTDEHFETSFRVYLLPVFPKDAPSMSSDAVVKSLRWEVALIEWSQGAATTVAAYHWARDFCQTLRADLLREPKIIDSNDRDVFYCTFTEGDRMLQAYSMAGTRYFSLQYPNALFDKKNHAAEQMQRKLQMNAIRPYK